MPLRDSDEQTDGAPAEWGEPPQRRPKIGRRRLLFAAVAVAMAFFAGTWAFGLWSPSDPTDSGESSAFSLDGKGVSTGVSVFPPEKRVTAPALDGELVDGGSVRAGGLQDEVVVINVWGSWCAPCRAESLDLARVARETGAKGVTFLGIDVRDDRASAQAFTRRYGITYDSLFDPNGRQLVKFSGVIPINAVPSTVIVDRDGRVAAGVIGPVDYTTLSGLIDDVLAESTSGGAT